MGVLRMSSPGEGQDGRRPGVMIPTPQYPLYSASLAEYNMEQVPGTVSEYLVGVRPVPKCVRFAP
jgi:hypothetical protein